MPQYGQVADPYSEIGFPMAYNPKQAAKQWKKQQKFMTKYSPYGMMGPGYGGFYQNDLGEEEFEHSSEGEGSEFDASFSHQESINAHQSSNTLGLIHPISEGKDTSHRGDLMPEPEFVKQGGRKYALLDWGTDE